MRQALLDDTYMDDGGVGADSPELLSELQDEIEKILKKGDFHIKAWESSGEEECSKYLLNKSIPVTKKNVLSVA